jgi:hypothetical protein
MIVRIVRIVLFVLVALAFSACTPRTAYDRASPEEKRRMTHEAWKQGLTGDSGRASLDFGRIAQPRQPIQTQTH